MTSEKLKPTPGPWIADNNEGFSAWTIWSRMTPYGNGAPGPVVARIDGDSAEADDSARLIAEAGTVFHECGLSPRELLEAAREKDASINELVDALRGITEMCEFHGDFSNGVTDPTGTIDEGNVRACEFIHAARATLAKHKEV